MNKKRNRDFGEDGFEGWGGYMAAKKAKLQEQFNEGAIKEGIFRGIAIHVNGYTNPTAEELKRIMMDNGGMYHHYYSTLKTTHIIATNLPDVKIKQLKSAHIKVVKPDWITASIEAGTLLDYRNFLLYTHQSSSQPSLNFEPAASTSRNKKALEDNSKSTSGGCGVENNKLNKPLEFPTNDIAAGPRPAKTAVDSNFLSEFYNNSRLHHISTMGVMFKQYVTKLREENQTEFPGIKRLKEWIDNHRAKPSTSNFKDDLNFSFGDPFNQPLHEENTGKVIMHIDMDCFFVSVGLRNRPELRGVPVAVTHSKGSSGKAREGANIEYERNFYKQKREAKIKSKVGENSAMPIETRIDNLNDNESLSEIASCSYEARRAGVKNGMFMGNALKLCPNLRTIPYDFEDYKEVAGILYNTVASYTLDIEAVSCDEMFVDCTSLLEDTGATAMEFAACLRAEIKEKTGCSASAGFGANRLLARLATKKAKPDGQYYLEQSFVLEHMKSIRVGDLPGVGYSMVYRLRALGIATCEDLQRMSLDQLRLEGFGAKTAESLYNHSRGKDDRPLTFGQERKSVSAEINYGIRFKTNNEAEDFLRRLSAEVHSRLKGDGARSITLKLMVRSKDAPVETAKYMGHGVCDVYSKSVTLPRAARTSDAIIKEVLTLHKSLDVNPNDLRGIGIQLARLEKNSGSAAGALDAFLVKAPVVTVLKPDLQVTPKKGTSLVAAITPQPEGASAGSSTDFSPLRRSEEPSASPASRLKNNNYVSPAGKIKSLADTSPSMRVKNSNISPGRRKRKVQIDKNPPPVNGRAKGTIFDFMAPRKKTPQKVDRMKLLDPDVLAELPEDIRHEILEEYSKPDLDFPPETLTAEAQADPQKRPLVEENGVTSSPLSLFNVTFSQVDPGYLQALPPDLRNEVETGLLERRERKKKLKESEQNKLESAPSTSRTVENGLRTGNDQAPGIDAEFLAALPSDLREELERDMQEQRTANHVQNERDDIGEDSNLTNTQGESSSGLNDSIITLRDALTPFHLRPLLRSWVESSGVPQVCDVQMITEFLRELITSRDIDSLRSIMLGLHRNIGKRQSSSWRNAYREIAASVQKTMLKVYKARLSIDDDVLI